MAERVALVVRDLPYMPIPNTVEVVVSDEPAPADLTGTSFLLPVDGDDVLLAVHLERGIEVAGGHVEPGETVAEAAARELLEETGAVVDRVVPVGFLRMTVHAPRPEGYRYPWPTSYQQFHAGRLVALGERTAPHECGEPVRRSTFEGLRPSIAVFAAAAREATARRDDPQIHDGG